VRVTCHFVPPVAPVPPAVTAVVIDVLRATTTLTIAMAHGARRVRPAATPEQAFALRRRFPDALLCGERDGRRVEGFDLGNSPAEYGATVVAGRDLIFASTNGSQALLAAHRARRRVLAAFVNASAVLRAIEAEPEVVLIASGKLGRFSLEDAALAGWLCAALERRGATLAGAAARAALALAPQAAAAVRTLVEGASHGRYLRRLGPEFAADLAVCASLDTLDRAFEV